MWRFLPERLERVQAMGIPFFFNEVQTLFSDEPRESNMENK